MRKLIGITGGFTKDTSGRFSDYKLSYVSDLYVKSVIKAGGIPIIIPVNTDKEVIKSQIEHLDGIIMSGGADLDPRYYNEEQLSKTGTPDPLRDIFDKNVFEEAKALNLPILGICRGMQAINVFSGGSMYQDLTYNENLNLKHDQWSLPYHASHSVNITKDSILYDIFNSENVWVNSFHHQVVKQVAPNFRVIAHAKDGAIEAIESLDNQFILGIQWHPEMMAGYDEENMLNLFKYFVEQVERYEK